MDISELLKTIDEKISEIENDDRYKDRPASVFSNAPLALIQTEMKTQVKTLKWVKEQLK